MSKARIRQVYPGIWEVYLKGEDKEYWAHTYRYPEEPPLQAWEAAVKLALDYVRRENNEG